MFRRHKAPRVDRDPAAVGLLRRSYSGFMGSSVTLMLSGILMLVLLAGAVYVVAVPAPQGASGAPSSGAGQAPDAAPAAPSTPSAPPECADQPAVAVPPETLVETTYTTQWVPVDGQSLPQSQGAGPAISDWPRRCFSRTPEGALYAISTLLYESLSAGSNDRLLTLAQTRFAPTGAYQQQINQLQQNPAALGVQGQQPSMTIIGYRWAGYTPDTASIELQWVHLDGPSADSTVAISYQAQWSGNDWLMLAPSNRSALYRAGADSRTFTSWGPTA